MTPLLPVLLYAALGPGVEVIPGPVNGLLVHRNGRTLAVYGDPRPNPPAAERVLFTHSRRDVAWAGVELVARGSEAAVPAGEADLFTAADRFWQRFRPAHDYAQQSTKVLRTSIPAAATVRGGDRVEWQGLTIQVMDTPGYTRGAVSYLMEINGRRIACTGDLIYGDGVIIDLYSLQDAIPEVKEDGYHGYAARAAAVIASLRKIAAWHPDVLVPARGPLILKPEGTIARLIGRLQAVMESHFEIDALRWYRGDEKLRAMAQRISGDRGPRWMPMAETVRETLPRWIVPIQNTRLLISETGGAFAVDCGSPRIAAQIRGLREQGRFKTLEGIFVTHYHDDHTNDVQALAEEFQCPVYATRELRDILEKPAAYRMPALTANPIRRVQVMAEGARRRWHEFEFTYSWFPGQTLYHDALLARKAGGETVFFVGDSFTPTGMDDYCLLNRNFLAPEKGFSDCLDVLKKIPPDHLLINQHVAPAFRFSPGQVEIMAANFARRRQLMRDLFPWDDPNYGVDEQWARFYPYQAEARAGGTLELRFMISNHSPARQRYRITPRVPAGWRAAPAVVAAAPRAEATVTIPVAVPADARGQAVITADVAFGKWELREWAEALVTVR